MIAAALHGAGLAWINEWAVADFPAAGMQAFHAEIRVACDERYLCGQFMMSLELPRQMYADSSDFPVQGGE
jgi:hypothetical protein